MSARVADREAMDGELMEISRLLAQGPEAREGLKQIRSTRPLPPGVYYNAGIRMVERVYESQRVALGHRTFRLSKDPDAPIEELRRSLGIAEGR